MFLMLVVAAVCLLLYNALHDLYLIYIRGMPPGPLSLPLIGGVHHLNPKQPHLSLEKLGKHYGNIFSLRMGPMGRAVILQDIKLINQLFEHPDTHDRPALASFDQVNNGADGIGSCKYDARWRTMTKAFHKGLSRMSSNIVEDKTTHAYRQLMDRFKTKGQDGTYYPRNDLIKACSAVFSSLVYGIESETLESPELNSRICYHIMLMSILNPTNPMNLLPVLWKFPSRTRNKLFACVQERDSLFNERFDNHMERYDGSISDVMDIITNFEQNNDNIDDEDDNTLIKKKDMYLSAWTIYLAGCDTTTDTTLWILLYMCVFTDVQENIQQEIDSVFPDEMENILEEKEKLNYTRAAILECLRLSSPIAMGVPRVANKDIQLGGYNIPKDTVMMSNQWLVHHDETNWPQPFELKPERFLDQEGQLYSNYKIFQKMPFIPFSRGKRPCLGQHVALDMLLIFTILLLKKMVVQLPPGFKPDLSGNVVFNLRPNEFPIKCIQR